MKRYRVASTKLEEIHTGASFLPGEEAPGFDPSEPEDERKLEEGLFVEIHEAPKREGPRFASKEADERAAELGINATLIAGTGKDGAITVGDVENAHENQKENA